MGNVTSMAGGPQQVVRLVRQDGKVLEFYNDMPVEELLVVYPRCVVCQDQVQENGQVRRKMLSSKDVLLRGQVYLLLQQQKAHPSQGQRVHANGVNGPAHRVPKIHPVDVPTAGREHSAHPPQHKRVVAKPDFPRDELNKILEGGSVKIITEKGTTQLTGPQLSRLLSQAPSHGGHKPSPSIGKSSLSPKASSLTIGLESIPE